MPWTIWLIAGLGHPFLALQGAARRRALIAFAWFVLIFLFFSIPQAKQQRYILPIVPAMALLCAQVWRDHQVLARRGMRDDDARLLWLPHWIALTVTSVVFTAFLGWETQTVELLGSGWRRLSGGATEATVAALSGPRELVLAPMPGPIAIMIGAALLGISVAGWRWHARWRPGRACFATAAWAVLFATVFWHAYSRAPSGVHPIRLEAERIAGVIDDAPLRSLRIAEDEAARYQLNEEFRIYFGRLIPRITPEELDGYASSATSDVYVLAKTDPDCERILRTAGYESVDSVRTDKRETQLLWRRQGKGP
jgi:hypothetical protein